MVTPRKRKTRHTDPLGYLNGINRTPTRVTRKRRQTAPRADIPVSPEKPAKPPGQEEASSDDGDPAQEPSEPGSDHQSTPEENEDWHEAQEPSNNDDDDDDDGSEISETPRNNEEEGLEDPFPGDLNLYSDDNEAPSGSSESSVSEVQEEQSPDTPESRAESTPKANSAPEPIRESGSDPGSEAGPDDRVAVVIRTRPSGGQADGEGRHAGRGSPSGSQYPSVPETPPTRPPRPTRSARARADDLDRDLRGRTAEIPTVESNQTENRGNGDGILCELRNWFSKEIDRSTMEADWRTLWTQGTQLTHYRSKPMPEYLQESRRLIAHLQGIYEDQSALFSSTQEALENIRECIYADVKQVFEYASETVQDASVLDQFEAHLIPRMVTLIQFSFRTFTILGRPAANQLHGTLDLVLRCSVRVDDYKRTGYLPAQARSRPLHLPLKRLKAALKDGRLNNHLPAQPEATQTEPQPSQLTQDSISPSRVPWTPMEEEALLDGLRQYTGDDRFLLIIRNLGHRLRNRTVRDLKAKHHEFRRQAIRNRVLGQFPWL